jgi:hypothetical protein
LSDAVELIAAGKTAVITTVPHGVDDGASFDLALNRPNLPGLVRLQRIRANLQMPAVVMAVSANPAYVVGQGAAGEEEIPALIERLRSSDAAVRAESASDLRTLGPKASAAAGPLTALLEDATPAVRMSAAAALLRITSSNPRAVAVLTAGMQDADPLIRAQAARAAGLAGESAAALAPKLASLLSDSDELTRLGALQAVATIGPAAAGSAPAMPLMRWGGLVLRRVRRSSGWRRCLLLIRWRCDGRPCGRCRRLAATMRIRPCRLWSSCCRARAKLMGTT